MEETKKPTQEELDQDITDPTAKRMSTKEFWIRFAAWVFFALIVPFCYIAIKYQLITPNDSQETAQYKITGWGVVAVIFIAVIMITLMKEVVNGLPQGSMLKQCIKGAMMLIPFILLALMLNAIKNTISAFESFLVVMIISEAIAVPINPLPKWGAQNNEDSIFKAFSRALAAFKGTGDEEPKTLGKKRTRK